MHIKIVCIDSWEHCLPSYRIGFTQLASKHENPEAGFLRPIETLALHRAEVKPVKYSRFHVIKDLTATLRSLHLYQCER